MHRHEYDDETSRISGHIHTFDGETSTDPGYVGHVHYMAGYTSIDKDHRHYYSFLTSPGIIVDGGHVHYYQGVTSIDGEHMHFVHGYTSVHHNSRNAEAEPDKQRDEQHCRCEEAVEQSEKG